MKMKRDQLLSGRRLLKRLLPVALEEAKSDTRTAKVMSEVAEALQTHLTIDKFEALVIHEGELGGWLVELLLRDMPPGHPSAIGTPVREPHRTRQEAQDGALELLIYAIKIAQANTKPPADPIFEYYDCAITILTEILDMLFVNGFGESPSYTVEHALERLREIDMELFPQGFSKECADGLPKDAQARWMSVVHLAAATGVFRFPEIEAKPPPLS